MPALLQQDENGDRKTSRNTQAVQWEYFTVGSSLGFAYGEGMPSKAANLIFLVLGSMAVDF